MISVYGLLGEPGAELRRAAGTAELVVAGRRHLDALAVPEDRRLVLGPLEPAIERLADFSDEGNALVVASGDPLFFGVVRRLRARGLRPTVVPAVSAVTAAFAAIGLPWEDAAVVSAHGRSLAPALNVARANDKVAVFTSTAHGVRELAAGLVGLQRWFVVAERLGEPDQRVQVLSADDAARTRPREPNVVLVLAQHPSASEQPWSGWLAAPDRRPRPQVSAAAAVAFTRLLPEPGELLWASGPLADEVAALARWTGAAAILGGSAPTPSALTGPAAVLLAPGVDGMDLTGVRAVVLTDPDAERHDGFRWSTETVGAHTLRTGVRR